jgi:hypothetical protein
MADSQPGFSLAPTIGDDYDVAYLGLEGLCALERQRIAGGGNWMS